MFNRKNAELEIANAMETNLVSKVVDDKTNAWKKLETAVEHLNAAAQIFDEVGLQKEAEYATTLLEMAVKVGQATPSPTDPWIATFKANVSKLLPPNLARGLRWKALNFTEDGQVYAEVLLPSQYQQVVYNMLPKGPSGKPPILSNYLSEVFKKADPHIRDARVTVRWDEPTYK